MALSEQEKAILEFGKQNGKSLVETKAAIAKYRQQNPQTATPVTPATKTPTFIEDAKADVSQMDTGIDTAFQEGATERQRIRERVASGEITPARGTFHTLGKGLQSGFKAIGEATVGLAKMVLPQSVEDKIKEGAQGFGEKFVKYNVDFYNKLKEGDVPEQEIAKQIDSVVEKYKTDETFRDDVNAAGGFVEAVGSMLGLKVGKEVVEQSIKQSRKLAPELDTPYFRETEDAVTKAIDATVKSKQPSVVTPNVTPVTNPAIIQQNGGVIDKAIDLSILGAQKTAQTYRDLVDASQTRIIRNLDNQAIRENSSLPLPEVEQNIAKMYINAVSPGVKGKKVSTEGITANTEQAKSAIKDLTINKNKLKFRDIDTNEMIEGALPTNLWEFGGAVTARKSQVYQEVLAKIGQASTQPVDSSRISDAMLDIIDNPVYANETSIVNRARQVYEKYSLTEYTPSQLEDLIKLENDRLQAFYRGQGTQADAIVSAITVNNLRDMLDEAVEAATGEGVRNLKKEYGNLKAIERDVVHRALHNAQAREAGLVDMFGIRTIGDVAAGAAGDLGALKRGAAQIAGEGFIKALNDRDAMINRMFMVADQAYTGVQNTATEVQRTQ